MSVVAALLWAVVGQSVPAASSDDFKDAIKCRAYAPTVGAFLTQQQTRKFVSYWVERTEALGKANGQTPQQVNASTLTIPIEAKQVDQTLADCLKAWASDPKSQKPL